MGEPRRIWWARPRKLCALERPGGGGRSHRPERRAAEIEYLRSRGGAAGRVDDAHAPQPRRLRRGGARTGTTCRWPPPRTAAEALEELLALLRRETRASGAVAIHGNRHTDFVAAVCAAHLHEWRGVDPALALARAAAAGLTVTPAACALIGVRLEEVDALRAA